MFKNLGWQITNDNMVYGWDQLKAATEFKKKLYDNGVVDKGFATDTTGANAQQDFVNGKLGIWSTGNGSTTLSMYQSLKQNNPDAEIIPIPMPATEFGQFAPPLNALGGSNRRD